MTYKTCFPDYDNGAEFDSMLSALGNGWEDSSWQNDTCPSMTFESEFFYVQIFVDYADMALSEFPDTPFRFSVSVNSAMPLSSGEYMPEFQRDFIGKDSAMKFARIMVSAGIASLGNDLDSICRAIQEAAGVTDGGVAGMCFTCLSDSGLDLPEQWASLPETEKARRVYEYAKTEFNFSQED